MGLTEEKLRKDEIRLESNMGDDKCEPLLVHSSDLLCLLIERNIKKCSIISPRQTSAYVGCFSDVSSEKKTPVIMCLSSRVSEDMLHIFFC